ncbi:hypothetical protein [Flammeovirga pacifica]|nr:hypothetical protein [Flammeovirga pacifica]
MQQHFFFQRDFLEYHKDRFKDYSLIVRDDKSKIVALFPATISAKIITSHAGVTFGGLLYRPRTFVQKVIVILSLIEEYYKLKGVFKLNYKVTPYVYKSEQGEEDVYALFKNDWKLIRRDFSTIININNTVSIDRSRNKNLKIAERGGVEVRESNDLSEFWNLLNINLNKRHTVNPTHSLVELQLLKTLFSKNICLIGGYRNGILLGGALLFITERVCKVQYSVNSEEGRKYKVLDAIFMSIINKNKLDFIDFGHSCENNGSVLNVGLSRFKYQFRGESLVHDFYEKDLRTLP